MSPVLAPAIPDRPYPGIEAFDYADHAVFFAREEESDQLLRQVTVYRGVLVYGPSGAGKSSLINAGFVPRAIADGFTPDRIRLRPRPGQEIVIDRIAVNAEGRPPYLPSSFTFENEFAGSQVLSIGEFHEKLFTERSGDCVPILIFDQFEEFVSLFEEAPRSDALQVARQVQGELLDLIVSLHREPELRVKLVFAFREDYLAKLGKLFNRCPDLRDIFLHLTAPRTAALEQMILGPFRRFPGHFPHEFPETLARQLQSAIEQRSDSSQLNLSEVQIACQRLWLSIDPEHEFAHKGLQGLLEDYLAESLARLHADLHDPAVALLSRMVTGRRTAQRHLRRRPDRAHPERGGNPLREDRGCPSIARGRYPAGSPGAPRRCCLLRDCQRVPGALDWAAEDSAAIPRPAPSLDRRRGRTAVHRAGVAGRDPVGSAEPDRGGHYARRSSKRSRGRNIGAKRGSVRATRPHRGRNQTRQYSGSERCARKRSP